MVKKQNQLNPNYLQIITLMEKAIADFMNKLTENIQKVDIKFSPNNHMITYHDNILTMVSSLNKLQSFYFNNSKSIISNNHLMECFQLSKKSQ